MLFSKGVDEGGKHHSMHVAAPIMIGVGLLLLLGCRASFRSIRRKLRTYVTGLATVVQAYSQEKKDSDGDLVTYYYNVISIRSSRGEQLNPITLRGRREVGEQYLLLYDPAGPVNTESILDLSLGSPWTGPLFWLFIAILLIALPLLFYLFG